jgi:hypothetical protein
MKLQERRVKTMPHVVVTTGMDDVGLLEFVKNAVAARVPPEVVVVVDEVLITRRLTTDQEYVNPNAVYVVLHHGGNILSSGACDAIGAEITVQYPGYQVVFSASVDTNWWADGKKV